MLNQTSFRLVSTLLPTDMQAKTTKVINKVNAKGESYYPTFTNETVVLTNEDRTVMETAKASCRDGVLSFSKRGLSDDQSETTIEKRKLTRNPGSICFVTYGAGDTIDKDDDNTWTGKQIYTGEMVSKGSATYEGRLITKWGIEYPVFKTLEDLKKYSKAFAGMFAVVESDGELYKYNALSKLWWVVTTNNPTEIAKASKSNAGVVRIATDEEARNGSETGTDGATLVLSPTQAGKKASTTNSGTVRIATLDDIKNNKHKDDDGTHVVPTAMLARRPATLAVAGIVKVFWSKPPKDSKDENWVPYVLDIDHQFWLRPFYNTIWEVEPPYTRTITNGTQWPFMVEFRFYGRMSGSAPRYEATGDPVELSIDFAGSKKKQYVTFYDSGSFVFNLWDQVESKEIQYTINYNKQPSSTHHGKFYFDVIVYKTHPWIKAGL